LHENDLDPKEFPFIDAVKSKKINVTNTKRKKGANERNGTAEFDKADASENPRIFTFILGGMSHNEVVSIAHL
jgi:hypothetical protein